MSDRDLRASQRRLEAAPDVASAAQHLLQQLRHGRVERARVELAALVGDAAAREALGDVPAAPAIVDGVYARAFGRTLALERPTEVDLLVEALQEESMARTLLASLEVDVARILREARRHLDASDMPMLRRLFRPNALRDLGLRSLDERDALGHDRVGPEHLLLALLRSGTGLACEVLTSQGLAYDDTREQLRDLVAGR